LAAADSQGESFVGCAVVENHVCRTSDIGGGSADGLGGEMMFVHLDTSEDQEYSKQEIDVYLRQWKELLQTGGITAQVYNIGSATTLVTVPGYQSQQAKDFLLSRPEVVKVRFDNQDYHKDEL